MARFALLLTLLLLVSVPPALAAAPSQQAGSGSGGPGSANVLLVVADDMRADSLPHMPGLQELAQRGVTFTRGFATTPLCCPSRASILTGQYARNHGVLANNPPLGGVESFDDRSTLATWLQAAGVRTGLIGRYLNGYESLYVPPGWDFWFALWQYSDGYGSYQDYQVTDHGKRRYYGSAPDQYSTRVFSQQARKFLAAEQDRPFMLHLTPRTPHGPATPDRRDAGTFKSVDLPISPALNEPDVSDKPKAIRERDPLEEKELEQLNRFRRLQLDSLLGLDRAILEIVEALRADGRLDRTWIIFTSDNGLALGEHRIGSEKSCPYEECVHVPFVVIPPAGQVVQPVDSRLVANIDLAPTIAQILGVEPPSPLDGRSLLPLFGDQPPAWRDGLLLEMAQGDDDGPSFEAIRSEDWKYVRHASAEEELYDLSTDPYELENLAGVPAHSADKARLAARLTQLLAEHTRPAAVRPPRATEAQ